MHLSSCIFQAKDLAGEASSGLALAKNFRPRVNGLFGPSFSNPFK